MLFPENRNFHHITESSKETQMYKHQLAIKTFLLLLLRLPVLLLKAEVKLFQKTELKVDVLKILKNSQNYYQCQPILIDLVRRVNLKSNGTESTTH